MARAAIGLGSNLGDRHAHLDVAVAALRGDPACRNVQVSPIIETDPVGPPGQGPYLNAALVLDTDVDPVALLLRLWEIEASRGRDRSREIRWGPRTLDLDLLLYDNLQLHHEQVTIPHPRLHERRFVLEPLVAIAPDWLHPARNQTMAQLLRDLPSAGSPQAPTP